MNLSLRRMFLLVTLLAGGQAMATDVNLDQGLSPQQLRDYNQLSQGSRLLPLSWLLALERVDSNEKFLSNEALARYGLMPSDPTSAYPQLPRGFVADTTNDNQLSRTKLRWQTLQSPTEPWVGLTCAACHTSQVAYKGQSFAVPGGQTQADLLQLIGDVLQAVRQTRADSAKFDRFARAVLGPANPLGGGYNSSNAAMLNSAMESWASSSIGREFDKVTTPGSPEAYTYGPGRLDAIGLIFQATENFIGAEHPSQMFVDAPINYPHLWNIPQFDKVQWNGLIPNQIWLGNTNIAALARNIGEVTGVFADVVVKPLNGADQLGILSPGFDSSINIGNLLKLEEILTSMKAPAWPAEMFGTPDTAAVARGAKLFIDTGCSGCHELLPKGRDDLATKVNVYMAPLTPSKGEEAIGTDPWMACNAVQDVGDTGVMKGMKLQPLKTYSIAPAGSFLGDRATMVDIGTSIYIQVVVNQKLSIVAKTIFDGPLSIIEAMAQALDLSIGGLPTSGIVWAPPEASPDRVTRLAQCLATSSPYLAYKGRPLNGIWATPPFLHNGSVPTLYDLLLPPEQRPTAFYTGGTEFDPVKVGYISTAGGANTFLFDTSRVGNSNSGHDYGTSQLSEQQRLDLVEYMKSI